MFAVGIVSLFSILVFATFASAASTSNCTINLTNPTAGTYHNGTITIQWTYNGSDCNTTPLTFNYNSPSNDGNNFYQIGSAIFANVGSITFDTTATYNGDIVENANDYVISVLSGSTEMDRETGFTIDNTPPTILSATTNDSDGNGKIDQLIVKFDESMDSSVTNITGITFASHTLPTSNGAWSNSNKTLTIPVTENGNVCDYTDQTGCDTNDTSNVAYSSGNLTDLAGNALNSYTSAPAIDGAMPAMVGAKTFDTNNNGYIDTIKVVFSEDLNSSTLTGGNFDVFQGYTVASASETSPGKVTINLTEKSGIGGDTGVTPEVSIMSGSPVQDNATIPNLLGAVGSGSTVIPSDGAPPIAMMAEYFNKPTASSTVDRFRVYFSEPISTTAHGSFNDITYSNVTVVANGLTGFANPTTIGDYTDGNNNVYFARTAGGTTDLTGANGGGEPTWNFIYNTHDTLQDTSGNLWTTILPSAKTIVDKAVPVVLYAVTLDKNSDGISGTLELKFSEDIKDYHWYAQKWSLSSGDGSFSDKFMTFSTNTINAGGTTNTPNDEYVSMNITSPSTVVGTGVMKYMYSGGGVADIKGNLLANIPFIDGVTTDGAKPQITKLTYKDQNGDGKIDAVTVGFSEPVTAASVLSANDLKFTSIGDFTGMALGTNSTDLITGTVSSVTIPLGTDATVQDTRDDSQSIAFKTQNAFRIEDADSNTNTNIAPQTNAAIVDGAAPVLLTADSSTVGDGNGNTEKMTLKYTENVNESPYESSVTQSDYVVKVAPNGAQIPVSSVLLSPNSHPEQIVLTLDTTDANQTTAPFNVSYSLGTVTDWVNNKAATGTYNITDKARPILIGFTAIPNPAKIGDNLGFKLKFSEPMDSSSVLTDTAFGLISPFSTYDVDDDASAGHTNGFIIATPSIWQGNYHNNPIVLGIPVSGTHTFDSVGSGKDPAGNPMVVLSGLDMTFVIDSVPPATSGVSATSVKVGENTTVTASATDDTSGTSVASATYKITNLDTGTVVATGAMNATDGAFGDTTEGLTASVPTSTWVAGNYKVRVLATDGAGNTESGSLVNVDTFAIAPAPTPTPSDTTPPAGSVTTTATTVNAGFYSITGTLVADTDNVTITINNGSADVGTAVVIAGGTSWSVTVPLPQNTATTFTAKATDASSNTATIGSVTITEDSTGPINLMGLSISGVTDVAGTINWSTDVTADSGEYRIGASPYNGTWASLTIGGNTSGTQALSGLTANTTYYYQVRFVKNSQTIYSAPLMFTTASASTGLSIDSIQTIKSYATTDDTYANGWKWKFNVTLNDLTETGLAMKFDKWLSGTNTLDAANNMRYSVDDATWTTIIANGTYPTTNIDVSAINNNTNIGGRQVTIYVEMKVPTGTTGGSYSTSYGVRSQ